MTTKVSKDMIVGGVASQVTPSANAATITASPAVEVFYCTATTNITFTFAGAQPTGTITEFVLELTNGGAYTITWPASVDWPSGTAPTLTTSGKDILVFYTRDGGTTWSGALSEGDSR